MLNKLILFSLVVLFVSCFDYKEVIFFNSNFSGHVEFDYRVPLYPEQDRSIIAFLPVNKNRIKNKFKQYTKSKQIRIGNIKVNLQSPGLPKSQTQDSVVSKEGEDTEIFRRFARVRYKIYFNDPVILEQILPGGAQIRWRGNRFLHIKRKFRVAGGVPEKNDRLIQGVYKLTRDMLQGKEMVFKIQFPESHVLKSNKGRSNDNRLLTYVLPLESSLYESKAIIWNYSLHYK